VIWGRITGEAAARHALGQASPAEGAEVRDAAQDAVDRLDSLRARQSGEDPYQLRKQLWETMDTYVHVYRDTAGLQKAQAELSELRARYAKARVADKSEIYNTNLRDTLEIGNMIELAQTVVAGAMRRRESRGSHAMVEFPRRDDAGFLKHTLTYRTEGLPRVSYAPVAITRWQPAERKY
jgi:succinate dehydrogenase/fumarate reductase flavoprotein subunit